MDNVITQIVEIEKQCAEEVEKAEREYEKKIETYKNTIEEKKAREFALIISEGNERLAHALEEAERQTEAAFSASTRNNEKLYQDPALNEEIKGNIVSILLTI
jgi:Zn-dependent M32 family carboxypeptidase